METVNSYSNTVIIGTGNADSITNYGSYVTINAEGGNDFIYTNGQAVISSGNGADTISVGSSVSYITLTDINTANDALIFEKEIPVASLRHSARDDEVRLTSSDMTIVFQGVSSLSPAMLNYTVRNGNTTNTLNELIGRRVVNAAIPTDIVFLVDRSSSMSRAISGVKNNIDNFVDSLEAANFDVRLGLVDYESTTTITSDLIADIETFKNGLSSIANGVGYERGLTAIMTASSDLTFRDEAFREYIVVTDEGYGEILLNGASEGFYDNNVGDTDGPTVNASDVKSALSGVHLDVFGATTHSDCKPEWEPIATTTGGQFYTMGGGFGDLIAMLSENIMSAATHVKIDLSSVADDQTGVFSANSSVDYIGDTIISDETTFYTSSSSAGSIVGSVSPSQVYTADSASVRQIITVPGGWNVNGTDKSDDLYITGDDAIVSLSAGNDRITVGSGVKNIVIADLAIAALNEDNEQDVLVFEDYIKPGTLRNSTQNDQLVLSASGISFTLQNLSSLSDEVLDYRVRHGDGSNTIKELIEGVKKNNDPPNSDASHFVKLSDWQYGFNPKNSIVSLASLADEDFTADDFATVLTDGNNNSLWGGAEGDDTLIGSSGYDEFFYLKTNGNDVIEDAGDDDLINLLNINLGDIDLNEFANSIGEESTTLKFNDGGSIKVNGTSQVGFKLADVDCTFCVKDRQWAVK